MRLENDVLRHIGALSRSIHSINDIKFKQFHLQRSQFIFLTRIYENSGLNQMTLTTMLKVDKATTTKAVQKLIAEGYVGKQRDAEDRRAWNLYPTEKAKTVYEAIITEENRDIGICLAAFNKKDRERVCELIRRMNENIEQEWKKYKNYKC